MGGIFPRQPPQFLFHLGVQAPASPPHTPLVAHKIPLSSVRQPDNHIRSSAVPGSFTAYTISSWTGSVNKSP